MKNNIKILFIDDEEEIRYALKAIFDYEGWGSYSAADVHEGLEAFKHNKPDIVLIDYHLPKVNGIIGVRMLRQLSPDIPIIVFTIDESQEVANSFLEAGASDFALKPIKAPDLISRINLHIRLLDSHKALAAVQTPQKGIHLSTLKLVKDYILQQSRVFMVEDVANGTGIATQTAYRYLQYLLTNDVIETKTIYGKVGRPKQGYINRQ